MSAPLQVAAVVDAATAPRWVERVLRDVAESSCAELAACWAAPSGPRRTGGLHALYERADRRAFAPATDAFAAVDIGNRLSGEPPAGSEFDVILDLREGAPGGPPALAARSGVWWLEHGERGGDGFWELHERRPVTRGRLVGELPGTGRVVLYESWSRTHPTSLHRARSVARWKEALFFARSLRDLERLGPTAFAERARAAPRDGAERPTSARVVRHAARLARAVARRRAERLFHSSRWVVAARPRPGGDGLPLAPGEPFHLLTAPTGRYYADPFVLEHEGRHWLFVEDFDIGAGRAAISAVELRDGAPLGEPRVVLERDHHLSYPFVFVSDGHVYMLPESAGARRLDLYRATDFPFEWRHERTLVEDARLFDATLWFDDRGVWLWANVAEDGASSSDELHLFHAASLAEPLEPHPANPVVSDVRRARPAGRLFRSGDALIRPAQASSERYGGGIVLNRVDTLTATDYAETPVGRIDPDWAPGIEATHTYSRDGAIEALDAILVRRRRP